MISTIAWAVQPGQEALNRPLRLVAELTKLGVIDEDTQKVHHGRTQPISILESSTSMFLPGRELSRREELAVLSPIFLATSSLDPVWTDLYDDWSLAPDINPLYRGYARVGYAKASNQRAGLLTVNSEYMVRKLGRKRAKYLPNGVDENLAKLTLNGDSRKRLIIFGHFFSGRTDFKLIERVIKIGIFDEIIVGGIGKDSRSRRFFETLSLRTSNLRVLPWMTEQELVTVAGNHTIALIPNIVSDYTLSQDLMKAYTFMALGIPTICPMPLWPESISKEFAFLTGPGDRLRSNLMEWLYGPRPTMSWRIRFANINSWTNRARQVAEWL